MSDYKYILELQKEFFNSGETKSIDYRVSQLKKLKRLLNENEKLLIEAVQKDFRKSPFETYATEIGLIHTDINFALKNIQNWTNPKSVSGSLVNFPSKNYTISEPYGNALIISPWNYPILLALQPLVGAIAAGNTAIIKPSELTPHTSEFLQKLISQYFYKQYISVILGGATIANELIHLNFDYIFFTGSTRVGKIIMKAASEKLTPLTLELGGKSPCIVDKTANIDVTARRIAWGKFVNAGQTCVAPDYLLVHKSVKAELIESINKEITNFYGNEIIENKDYPRIINSDHFERLTRYLENGTTVFGGAFDENDLYIEPTLLTDVNWSDLVMQEEIFGPILPIIEFETADECINGVHKYPRPLALYVFTSDEAFESKIFDNISFGGGAVNDTIAHLGNHHLAFGGVGASGFGSYHGKASFDAFSHRKSVMKKTFWLDVPLRYPPYTGKLNLIKKILK